VAWWLLVTWLVWCCVCVCVSVAAGNIAESLNDERMLRPVDRRCYSTHQQLTVHTGSTLAAADVPAGLQRLLGNTTVMLIIRPHCGTTYVDAACRWRRSSVFCRSVTLVSKPGRTDQDAVWDVSSGGPQEPCVKLGFRSRCEGAILRGKGGDPL